MLRSLISRKCRTFSTITFEQLTPDSLDVPPLLLQDVASKDAQMMLLDENRKKSKQQSEAQEASDGKPKGKAKGKAKSKAKSKAKAKAKGKPKGKAQAQPKSKATAQPKSGPPKKRPAAVMQQPFDVPEQEVAINDRPQDSDDEVPDAETLPRTFARRARPTSTTGILKYAKIVKAFKRAILPHVPSRKMTTAEASMSSKFHTREKY